MDGTVGSLRDFAQHFYKSKAWQDCRAAYISSRGGLCERCFSFGIYTPAKMVHHIIHLSPENINDETVTLNFANLQALCTDCHAAAHRNNDKRYQIDELGRVIFEG